MLAGLAISAAVVVFGMLSFRRFRRVETKRKRKSILVVTSVICGVSGLLLGQWPYHYSQTVKIVGLPTPIAFLEWNGSSWADFVGPTSYLFFATNLMFWLFLPLCVAWFVQPKKERAVDVAKEGTV